MKKFFKFLGIIFSVNEEAFSKENKGDYLLILKICIPLSLTILVLLIGVNQFATEYSDFKPLFIIVAASNVLCCTISLYALGLGMLMNRYFLFLLNTCNSLILLMLIDVTIQGLL